MRKKTLCILIAILTFFSCIARPVAEDEDFFSDLDWEETVEYSPEEDYDDPDLDEDDELVEGTFYILAEDEEEENKRQEERREEEEKEQKRVNDIINSCKKKNGDEVVECCAVFPDEDNYNKCLEAGYKVCTAESELTMKNECCQKTFTDTVVVNNCKYYVERYCTPSDSVKINKQAMKIKVGYEPYEEDYPDEDETIRPDLKIYMLDIKVYNVSPELKVVLTSEDGTAIGHYDDSNDGVITFRNTDTKTIKNYKLEIQSDDVCMDKVIRTINLTLPKYNPYSEREICTEVPTYYLCQQFITYDIDSEHFLKDVQNYKARLEAKEIETADSGKVNKNITTKIVSKISKNKYIVVGVILAVGILITVLIVLRNKKKEDDEDEDF